MKISSEKYIALLAMICLLLVCTPRFNGNTNWVKQTPWDAHYFNAYVEYFRGEVPSAPIRPMTNARFLLPLLAHLLPFSAASSLNILNFFCLAFSLYYLFAILKFVGAEPKQATWAVFISIFSFPSFYYTCISYVDPGAILFLTMGVYAWLKEKYIAFVLASLLGLVTKETSILLFPFAVAMSVFKKQYKITGWLIVGCILFCALHYLIRIYAPLSNGEIRFKPLQFNLEAAKYNLQRTNTILSFILSLGLPGLLLLIKLYSHKIKLFQSSTSMGALGGLIGIFVLYLFSFFTTIADGRIIWHAYVFMFILIFERRDLLTEKRKHGK